MPADRLTLEDARFAYADGGWTLGPVSLSFAEGRVAAVIGPNGSGKSTLLQVAAGVQTPVSGRVTLNGRDMAEMDRRDVAKGLGYLPQQIVSTYDYTAEEAVAMGRFPHLRGLGFLSADDARVIDRSLQATETLPFRSRPLSHLSGGERQRVFLASVLAQEPGVLLLDEPTSALDIHHQAHFFRLLRQLAREGMAVAVVTHDLNLASLYCDHLFLMARGRALCEGAAEEVLTAERLTEAYGEHITVDRDRRTGKPIVLPVVEPEGGNA